MASNQQAEPRIEIGSVMRDTESGRIGVVQRAPEGAVRLHALSSDRHWEVDPDALAELTSVEALSARVAIANYWSRKRV
ncbi:hypothetical protein ABZY45_09180 [Streptomyces sp. NPDC006516]|uniref:hypothetical protein n=1 Tax=Streptomyces sp. NPDC006516 TaxID=3154309 RepID=UPI0033AFDF28